MAGHSQGIFGVESLKAGGRPGRRTAGDAQLLGAAGSLVSRRRGMVGRGDKSPMLSVTNADPDRIAELLHDFSQDVRTVQAPVLSIRNGRRSVRHHRHPRAADPVRAVLHQDHREGRGRAQEQAARRRGVPPGVQPNPDRGGFPHAAAGRRHRHWSTSGSSRCPGHRSASWRTRPRG